MADKCRLKIKDPALKRALGFKDADDVSFDSYAQFEGSIPVGTEFLVADPGGDYLAKFVKFGFSNNKLNLITQSQTGRGYTPVSDIKGWATTELLSANLESLDDLARARLVPPVPTTEVVEDSGEASGGSNTPSTVDYDAENSKVKMEQFESTTGQDVKSELDGTLDEKPSTLPKMVLKEAISENTNKYRFFVSPDSNAYFLEEGTAPTGEILLVVHSAAHDSLVAELGRPLTQAELNSVAVRINEENRIAAEGQIYTLSLEGSLQEGEDTFFKRNHQQRLEAYASKYATTLDVAEAHFRSGQKRLQDARTRSRSAPVEVKVKSVSLGSSPNQPMEVEDFVDRYGITETRFEVNTSRDGVRGRVYLYGNMNGQPIKMLTVPTSLLDKYGFDFLLEIGARFPDVTADELAFFESIFGVNRRQAGPYVRKGVLMSQGHEITTQEDFARALRENSWAAISPKVKEGTSTIWRGGTFQEVSNVDFISEHVETDGSMWTHNGTPVPYLANRYLYLDIPTSRERAGVNVTDSRSNAIKAINELFSNPSEYHRIAASALPEDMAIKAMIPQFFTPEFQHSVSSQRLLEGQRALNHSGTEQYAINAPVGNRYFGSKSVVSRKGKEIIRNYLIADLKRLRGLRRLQSKGTTVPPIQKLVPFITDKFPVTESTSDADIIAMAEAAASYGAFDAFINEKVNAELATLAEQGITTAEDMGIPTRENLRSTLFTLFANQFVAKTENNIIFGTQDNYGVTPEMNPSYWYGQKESPSVEEIITGSPVTQTPGVRNVPNTGGVRGSFMTLDKYRAWKQASNNWSEEEETQYQNELAFYRGDNPSGKRFPKTQVTLQYNGPVDTSMRSGANEELNTPPLINNSSFSTDFTVLTSILDENAQKINRAMMTYGEGVMIDYLHETLQLPYFTEAQERPNVDPMQRELQALQSVPADVTELEGTEIFQYAQARLGKTFAGKLLNTGKTVTFADIDRFAEEVGNSDFTFTRFNKTRDFAISSGSAKLIAEGRKTLTIRKTGEEAGGTNKSGLVEIEGKVFDIQEIGEMDFEKALQATRLTQQEFTKQFLGDDTKSIEDIFDSSVKAFFDGTGRRRVFTITPVGKPYRKRTKTKKDSTKVLPCL